MKINVQKLKAISARCSIGVLALPTFAHAAETGGIDYAQLLSGINFDSTKVAVMAIAASLGGLYLAIRGARTVLGMVRR
jgi:hypothetical protein